MFFFAESPQKADNILWAIYLAYSCISFVQLVRNSVISSSNSCKRHFLFSVHSWLRNKQVGCRVWKRGWSMVYHNLYPRIEYCCIFQIWQVPVGYEELAVAERKRGGGGIGANQKRRKNYEWIIMIMMNNKIIIVIIIITIFFFVGVSFYSHRPSLLSVTQLTPACACNENKTRRWKRNLFSSQVIIWEDLSRAIIQWRYRPISSNKWRYGIHKI